MNLLNKLILFLHKIDRDFPVPLSEKVNLKQYAKKLIEKGNLKIELVDNNIVGLVAGYIDHSDGIMSYIAVVGVDSEFRGKSIAKKLLNEYIEECREKKIKFIHLYTDKSNLSAIQMYKKLGFYESKLENESRNEDVHFFMNLEEE